MFHVIVGLGSSVTLQFYQHFKVTLHIGYLLAIEFEIDGLLAGYVDGAGDPSMHGCCASIVYIISCWSHFLLLLCRLSSHWQTGYIACSQEVWLLVYKFLKFNLKFFL